MNKTASRLLSALLASAGIAVSMIAIMMPLPAHAMSMDVFDAKTPTEQVARIEKFLNKVIMDIQADHPGYAQEIVDLFMSQKKTGFSHLAAEVAVKHAQARQGLVKTSDVQIEDLIGDVIATDIGLVISYDAATKKYTIAPTADRAAFEARAATQPTNQATTQPATKPSK